jgi:hypothetical protein
VYSHSCFLVLVVRRLLPHSFTHSLTHSLTICYCSSCNDSFEISSGCGPGACARAAGCSGAGGVRGPARRVRLAAHQHRPRPGPRAVQGAHSLTHSLFHTFTIPHIHYSTHSLFHSLTHCYTHSLLHSLTVTLTRCYTHSLLHSISHSLITSYSLTHLLA